MMAGPFGLRYVACIILKYCISSNKLPGLLAYLKGCFIGGKLSGSKVIVNQTVESLGRV